MTVSELISDIKRGPCGVYFFYGCEEYLKRFYIGRMRKAVLSGDETFDSFNHYIIEDADEGELEGALGAVPMMAEKTLVEVNVDFSKGKKIDKILEMLEFADTENTVCIAIADENFDAGKKNKPSGALRTVSKFCKVVAFETQTPGELRKWMARRFSLDNLKITPECADKIIEYCGRDMFVLTGELDKLAAAALSRGMEQIGEQLVLDITISSREDDAFALANAVMNGDRKTALDELSAAKQRRDAAPMVLGSVSRSLSDMLSVATLMESGCDQAEIARRLKIHEYKTGLLMQSVRNTEVRRLAAALERCREADVQMKTSKLDYIALERLICTIPAKRRGR